ncbi:MULTISPECIES: exodeoxyribonuclease V subunit alpha [unclassified Moraxella]|uniref:exodeoxyribonuclease V subunit alpha n=1 Tax=unclassified Moraxella TaxID=2685852 RepID=UPI003AF9D7F1
MTTQAPQTQNISPFAEQLTQLTAFIELRQTQKQALTTAKLLNHQMKNGKDNRYDVNKNSLSKYKLISQQLTQKNDDESDYSRQALNKLMRLLGEQLNDGHTIYTLNPTTDRQIKLLKQWQQQGWMTDLVSIHFNKNQVFNNIDIDRASMSNDDNYIDNKALSQVNTPIVMQSFLTGTNDEQGRGLTTIFWLQRQWYAEKRLANQLLAIATRPVQSLAINEDDINNNHKGNEKTQPNQPNAEQQQAIDKASRYGLSIITGGPGTGKTFTVAQLVTRLQHAHDRQRQIQPDLPPLSIALTAPTGKASQRMQESLAKSLQGEPINLDNAKTLHRLLGIGQDGIPRYHADNPLPDDLVIVDEASMLGLELASLLVDAIKPTGRLILLGDANQLSAVDAGAVLADLCAVEVLQPYRTELVESKRFDKNSAIGQLALAIVKPIEHWLVNMGQMIPLENDTVSPLEKAKSAKMRAVYRLLKKQAFEPTVKPNPNAETHQSLAKSSLATNSTNQQISQKINNKLHENAFFTITPATHFNQVYQQLAKPYYDFFALLKDWYIQPQDIFDVEVRQQLFASFDSYRILTAGHLGQLGSQMLNKKMATAFFRYTELVRGHEFFYHGLPIMITHNDYQLGLFNGDIGICVQTSDQSQWVVFADKVIATHRLSRDSCEPAYAMTIHKSQGSEFGHVAVCLDRVHGRLLSQELIYTAVTRSKGQFSLFSQTNVLSQAILQKGNRQTGLSLQF